MWLRHKEVLAYDFPITDCTNWVHQVIVALVKKTAEHIYYLLYFELVGLAHDISRLMDMHCLHSPNSWGSILFHTIFWPQYQTKVFTSTDLSDDLDTWTVDQTVQNVFSEVRIQHFQHGFLVIWNQSFNSLICYMLVCVTLKHQYDEYGNTSNMSYKAWCILTYKHSACSLTCLCCWFVMINFIDTLHLIHTLHFNFTRPNISLP